MKKIAISLLCMSAISSITAMDQATNFEKTLFLEFFKTCLKKGRTSDEVFPIFKKHVKEQLSQQDITDFHEKYRNAQDVHQSGIDNNQETST